MAAESAFLHVMISLGMNTMFVGEDLIFYDFQFPRIHWL